MMNWMGCESTFRIFDLRMKQITYMVQKIWYSIMSIFLDISTYGERARDIYHPQDLTEHYKKELSDFSLDGVYISSHYRDISYTIEAYKYRSDRQYV